MSEENEFMNDVRDIPEPKMSAKTVIMICLAALITFFVGLPCIIIALDHLRSM